MPWAVEATEPVADCRVFDVHARRSRRTDGVEGTFYTVGSPDWVNVIALTPDERVVLIRQWRHGAASPVVEIPGGMVDAGEDPLDAAKRELAEETGYVAERWTRLGAVNPNPALFSNRLYSYLAEPRSTSCFARGRSTMRWCSPPSSGGTCAGPEAQKRPRNDTPTWSRLTAGPADHARSRS